MPSSRQTLLSAARCLCTDFSASSPTEVLLAHFSYDHEPSVIEHGHPALAPFVGREFVGRPEVGRYFNLLAELLTFSAMSFNEYIVDTETCKVACKGRATFTWKSTGQSWHEVFTYTLDFVEEGRGEAGRHPEVKVRKYQVWADTGAAYLASRGELLDAGK